MDVASPDTSSTLLEVIGLTKRYGGQTVVDELTLQLRPGQVLGLLGPNGAGKTTTIKMLYGLIPQDQGQIIYEGRDFQTMRTEAKRWIGVCAQHDTLDEDFNVEQNLRVHASYFRPSVPDLEARIPEVLEQFGLKERAHQSPRQLSGGYRRRLMIARSVIHQPRVLFLDEPTTGLDPRARVDLWERIQQMKEQGLGIILTTHYMDEAERLSDDLVVLSQGRSVATGTPDEVLGRLLGEHVIVVAPGSGMEAGIHAWAQSTLGHPPARILGELHLPMRSADLISFTHRFGELRFEVRQPNLDDLFQRLSLPSEDLSQ